MKRLACSTAAAALVLAACGGHSGTLLPAAKAITTATKSPATPSGAKLSVVIPHPSTTSQTRRPAYVSPSSAQLVVAVNGGPSTTYGLTATSPGCSVVATNTTCTFTIPAAAGDDTLALSIEDATGTVLSHNVVSAKLAPGVATPVNVTLAGIPASVIVAPGVNSGIEDGPTPAYHVPGLAQRPVELEALDADGNIIIGPGSPAISAPTVTQGSSFATIVSAGTTDPNAYVLAPTSGASGGQAVAISATAQSIALADGTQSPPVSSTTTFLFTPAVATITGSIFTEFSVETGNAVATLAVPALAQGRALTTDSNGNLWVSTSVPNVGFGGITVSEYPPGSTTAKAALSSGVAGGYSLASDSQTFVISVTPRWGSGPDHLIKRSRGHRSCREQPHMGKSITKLGRGIAWRFGSEITLAPGRDPAATCAATVPPGRTRTGRRPQIFGPACLDLVPRG